jgi:hypothetical protein
MSDDAKEGPKTASRSATEEDSVARLREQADYVKRQIEIMEDEAERQLSIGFLDWDKSDKVVVVKPLAHKKAQGGD